MTTSPTSVSRRYPQAWSGSHWLHLGIAIAAIWVYVIGGMAQTRIGAIDLDLVDDELSWPLRVAGQEVGSRDELAARIAAEPLGREVQILDANGALIAAKTVEPANSTLPNTVTRLNGFAFLAVTLLVFAPRAHLVPALDLYWACLLYGLAVMIGGVYAPPGGSTWPGALLPLARIVSLVVLPTLMLHVGLTFPRRAAVLDRYRWLMPLVAAIGLALAGWHFTTWLTWLDRGGAWDAIGLPRRLNGLFLAVVFGWGVIGVVRGSRRTENEREWEQVKWVLWGIAVGGAPYVFLHALPLAITDAPLISLGVARIFSLVIPGAFSLAVIRHRFLDVDIIIRRSLLYVLLASIMVGIYSLAGILVGRRVQEAWPSTAPFVPIVATLLSALLFTPTRRGIALLIDRVFFQIRYTHGQALTAFQRELRGTTDQQQAADNLARFLKRTLQTNEIAILLRHNDNEFRHGDWPEGQSVNLELRGEERAIAVPGTTARPEIEGEDFPRRLREAGFVLAHEVTSEGHRIGAVALGEKGTGRSYVAEDLRLLAAVTRETSFRVHRMNLEQDFVDEVVARHQMEEMGRFRTQFFAQFAHDLRSPLTSINWGARNLLDGVVGPVTAEQATYLEGIEASARQLVRLVNNLLEVTRLESGMPDVEFGSVDLSAITRESVGKLKATAATRGIDLRIDGADSAILTGNAEKLLEVIDNLVENAIRYSPSGSVVGLTLRGDERMVALTVEDSGPGIGPDDLDKIFEPYQQGTASPHSSQQGFGLGLFVVKSWTERMGGQVRVGNRPGGGARFDIEFPPASPATEDQGRT
jgi:signal transduction histidine kinase